MTDTPGPRCERPPSFPAKSQLLKVPLYVAGKSAEEAREELGLGEVLKLASNESPVGPSPQALAVLQQAAQASHRYPGVAERDLCCKLAAHHGAEFKPEQFIVGNGATDVLRMVAQAFICAGDNSVTCRVTFPLYALLTTMFGGETVRVEATDDLHIDLAALAAAITDETRVIWLCSPNNPTGYALSQAETDEFMARLPERVVVVFDESYRDFVTAADAANGLGYIHAGRNVVVVRSFSKSAGLANLRVGYGVGRADLIEYLRRTVLPFNTGGPVLRAAAASLHDEEHRRLVREVVHSERAFLHARLTKLGLHCLPSQANFVLIVDPVGGAAALVEGLLRRGVIVRAMDGFGLPNAVRVSVGVREQNEQLVNVLRAVLEVRPIQ